jgi:hypothetical protein
LRLRGFRILCGEGVTALCQKALQRGPILRIGLCREKP